MCICVTLFICIAHRRLHKIGNNSGRVCSSSKPQGYSVTFRVISALRKFTSSHKVHYGNVIKTIRCRLCVSCSQRNFSMIRYSDSIIRRTAGEGNTALHYIFTFLFFDYSHICLFRYGYIQSKIALCRADTFQYAELRYRVSEPCTIARIHCKRMELSFSPAASRQILKTTDSETEEAARTKKHLAEEKQGLRGA